MLLTWISEELDAPDELNGIKHLQDDALPARVIEISRINVRLLVWTKCDELPDT